MNPKFEYLVDLIYERLKNYKAKKIFLDKESLKKFIYLLYQEK